MMFKRGPRKLKTAAKSVIRFSLAIVVMDIADFMPIEVVLAHMVESVVFIEVVATVLLITNPLLKIQKTCQGGEVFRTKTEPRR
jgi:hypothetical protein